MKCNIGKTERILRILIGLAIIGFGIVEHNWLGAIGIIPLYTGLISWCPLYTLFGTSTKKS